MGLAAGFVAGSELADCLLVKAARLYRSEEETVNATAGYQEFSTIKGSPGIDGRLRALNRRRVKSRSSSC